MEADMYVTVDKDPETLAAERTAFGALADSVRQLVDATIRTTVDLEEADAVRVELDTLVARLRAAQIPGSYGVNITPDGTFRNHGNAVVGVRNAIAPPLQVERDPSGRAWSSFFLGAAYEGPPGLVHGGVTALLLDQIAGEAAAAGGSPGMTGGLSLRYRRPTPLGELSVEAWIDRVEGVKTYVHGELRDAEGEATVTCEGVFVLPRWARDQLAQTDGSGDPAPPARSVPPVFE